MIIFQFPVEFSTALLSKDRDPRFALGVGQPKAVWPRCQGNRGQCHSDVSYLLGAKEFQIQKILSKKTASSK